MLLFVTGGDEFSMMSWKSTELLENLWSASPMKIIHCFPLEVMIQLTSIVKVRLVNSSFLCQERKMISARIVYFISVNFFVGAL